MLYLIGENIKPVTNIGNIFFYILLAVLVVVVVVICLIFTRSKKFKVKMRENIIEKNPEYEAPRLVKIYDENVKQELLDRQVIAENKHKEEDLEKQAKEQALKEDNINQDTLSQPTIETALPAKQEESVDKQATEKIAKKVQGKQQTVEKRLKNNKQMPQKIKNK